MILLPITLSIVRAMLLRELPYVALGSVIIAIGIATIVLYRLRRDRALLWFGVFALVYGSRLLVVTAPIRIVTGLSVLNAAYLEAGITYVICLPIALLLKEIFPEWKRMLRAVAWGIAVFAVAGAVSDAWMRKPFSLTQVNSAIVLTGLLALLVALFHKKERAADMRALRAGLLLFSAAVIFENIKSLFGWQSLWNVEPLGLLAFLASFGRVIARRVLRNSERLVELDKELEIARRIQTSILPRQMPTGPGWKVAALYLPMTAVAGDFYDFLPVDEQRMGVLMADVSGHGVPAALIASMVKIAIAAQLPHAANPARVMAGMNTILSGNLQGQYVTAAYLYLDLEKGKALYAAAAHPPLLRQTADGSIEAMEENGLMLGLFSHAAYTEREFAIRPGDRFLLYTDGLTEAANENGDFFGDRRTRAALTGTLGLPVEEVLSVLREKVMQWAPSAQDDLTLLGIHL